MKQTNLHKALTEALGPSVLFTVFKRDRRFVIEDYPAETLIKLFTYGVGRFAQDRVNSEAAAVKKETGAELTPEQKEKRFADWVARMKAGQLTSDNRVGGDPVAVEAIVVFKTWLFSRLQVANAVEAYATEKGKRFFTQSAKSGNILDNVAAMRAFIDANPKLGIMERAKENVANRELPADDMPEIVW